MKFGYKNFQEGCKKDFPPIIQGEVKQAFFTTLYGHLLHTEGNGLQIPVFSGAFHHAFPRTKDFTIGLPESGHGVWTTFSTLFP